MKAKVMLIWLVFAQCFAQAQMIDSTAECATFEQWALLLIQSHMSETDAVEGAVLLKDGQYLYWKKQPAERHESLIGVKLELYLCKQEMNRKYSSDR
jgi:hypothetical protein